MSYGQWINAEQFAIADRWEELDIPGNVMDYRKEIMGEWTSTTYHLTWQRSHSLQAIEFTDDTGFRFVVDDRMRANGAYNHYRWEWDALAMQLRLTDRYRDVQFMIPFVEINSRQTGRAYTRQMDKPKLRDQRKRSLYDGVDVRGPSPSMLIIDDPILETNQGGPMGGTSNATIKPAEQEIPREDRAPELDVYYTINELPQQFTEKEVNDHVAKLLKLGQHVITVKRNIVDAASQTALQVGREKGNNW